MIDEKKLIESSEKRFLANKYIFLYQFIDEIKKQPKIEKCDGCKNIGIDCMHCMRAYSDCYEN